VFGMITTAPRFWKAYNARYRKDTMVFIAYAGHRPGSSTPSAPVAGSKPFDLREDRHSITSSSSAQPPEPPVPSSVPHKERDSYMDSSSSTTHSAVSAPTYSSHTVPDNNTWGPQTFQDDNPFSSHGNSNLNMNRTGHDGYVSESNSHNQSQSQQRSQDNSMSYPPPQQSSPTQPVTHSVHRNNSQTTTPPSNPSLPPVYNPNTQMPDPNQVASLLKACSDGDVMLVKQILSSGIDINVRDPIGLTAMHVVCIMGRTELAQWLLQQGASYSTRDKEGMTPLHYACDNKHVQLALLLVRNGADSSLRNKAGITSLHIVCIRGVMELTQLIRDYMINVATGSGLTLLHCAADQGHNELVKYLIKHGAQLHARDDDGMTPLHLACMAGHLDVSKSLIEAGAYWNARDDEGMSPLLYACQESQYDLVLMLIGCNANIYARNNAGATAMHLACEAGCIEVVQVLMERKLDCDVRRKDGNTPYTLAQRSGVPELVTFLQDHGIYAPPLEQDVETALRVQVENKAEAAIRAFEAEEEANLQLELMARAQAMGLNTK